MKVYSAASWKGGRGVDVERGARASAENPRQSRQDGGDEEHAQKRERQACIGWARSTRCKYKSGQAILGAQYVAVPFGCLLHLYIPLISSESHPHPRPADSRAKHAPPGWRIPRHRDAPVRLRLRVRHIPLPDSLGAASAALLVVRPEHADAEEAERDGEDNLRAGRSCQRMRWSGGGGDARQQPDPSRCTFQNARPGHRPMQSECASARSRRAR